MLAHATGGGRRHLQQVEGWIVRTAARREGCHYEILFRDQIVPTGCGVLDNFTRLMNCFNTTQEYRVRFKDTEFRTLFHLARHGIANGTKASHVYANLEQKAMSLWPTGSHEHVAMVELGTHAMWRYTTAYATDGSCIPFMGPCKQMPILLRIGADPGEGGTKKDGEAGATKDGDTKPDKVVHGGETAEDAAILATKQDRVVAIGECKAIVGQHFKGDCDKQSIVGALVGPSTCLPNVYACTGENALAAKEERLDKKARAYKGNKEDRARIAKFTNDACGWQNKDQKTAVFSAAKIRKWCEDHFHLEEAKSSKWSEKRLITSLDNLYKQAFPEFQCKASVKYEPMPEGKAPRLLIADGDDGQLMALIVVKCFEELLFNHMESKSIKHLAKRDAIARVVKHLGSKGKLIEGDGSAWDTTCNEQIRGQTENVVLGHIMAVVVQYGVVPEQWHKAHDKLNNQSKYNLLFNKGREFMRIKIPSIRRSGHRGTSCLNWWMNFTLWACSIFKEPWRFLDPEVRRGEDLTGTKRWWYGAFEGDDSLCALEPPMCSGDSLSTKFEAFWERQGFNMKIVYVDKLATFCGYNIACDDGISQGVFCPELPRALKNAGVSCASSAVKAAKDGDVKALKDIAAASSMARAYDFAGILPSVSEKFARYAESVKQSRDIKDREMGMRAAGDDGVLYSTIAERVAAANLAVTPEDEKVTLGKLQMSASGDEMTRFMTYEWSWDKLQDHSGFLESLPARWR